MTETLTTNQIIEEIERECVIYSIHACKAGWGMQFYEPPEGFEISRGNDAWKEFLNVHKYYPTLEDCINAEHERVAKDD